MDKIEQYLLEFAKLAEDVSLRKQALDSVQQSTTQVEEDEVMIRGLIIGAISCLRFLVGFSCWFL